MSAIESSLGTFFDTLSSTTSSFFTTTPLPNLTSKAEAAEILPQAPNPIVSAVTNHFAYVGRLLRDFYIGRAGPPVKPPVRVILVELERLVAPTKPWYEQHARSIIIGIDAVILVALLLSIAWSVARNWRHVFRSGKVGTVEENGTRLASCAKRADGDSKLAKGLDEVIKDGSCRHGLVRDVKTVLRARKMRLRYAKEMLEREWEALRRKEWWVGSYEPLSEKRKGLIAGITRVGRAIKGVEEQERGIEREDLRVGIRGGSGKCYYIFESKGKKVEEVSEKKKKTALLNRIQLDSDAGKEAFVQALSRYNADDTSNDNRMQDTQEDFVDATSNDDRVQNTTQERNMFANEKVEAKGGHQPTMVLVNDIEQMVEEYTEYLRESGKRLPESEKMRSESNEGTQSASGESDWDMLAPEDEGMRLRDSTNNPPTW